MWAPKRCWYTESLSSVVIRHARRAHLGYIWQTGKWVVYTFLSIIQTGKTPLVESISGRFILSTMALIICTAALSLPRKRVIYTIKGTLEEIVVLGIDMRCITNIAVQDLFVSGFGFCHLTFSRQTQNINFTNRRIYCFATI